MLAILPEQRNDFPSCNIEEVLSCLRLEGMLESKPVVAVGARLMVGRLTLDQLVAVQIRCPQLNSLTLDLLLP